MSKDTIGISQPCGERGEKPPSGSGERGFVLFPKDSGWSEWGRTARESLSDKNTVLVKRRDAKTHGQPTICARGEGKVIKRPGFPNGVLTSSQRKGEL